MSITFGSWRSGHHAAMKPKIIGTSMWLPIPAKKVSKSGPTMPSFGDLPQVEPRVGVRGDERAKRGDRLVGVAGDDT